MGWHFVAVNQFGALAWLAVALLVLAVAAIPRRIALPLIGYPPDARPADLLFCNHGYRASDSIILEEQIVAFASKLKETRDNRDKTFRPEKKRDGNDERC